MAGLRECPDCEATFAGRTCPKCGWSTTAGRALTTGATSHDGRCDFMNHPGGRRCYLAGDASTGRKSWYCGWHAIVRASASRLLGSEPAVLDEFERWTGSLLAAGYCTQWTHWTARVLWRAVQGDASPLAHPASGCRQPSCPHGAEQQDRSGEGVPIGRRQGRALSQQLLTLVTTTDATATEPAERPA